MSVLSIFYHLTLFSWKELQVKHILIPYHIFFCFATQIKLNFFHLLLFFVNEKVSKWNQEEVKVPDKEYKLKRPFEKRSDSPIRRGGRRRGTFGPAPFRRTHRRNRRWTSSRWGNKHMSNTIIDVDCWTLADRQNFPAVKCWYGVRLSSTAQLTFNLFINF